MKLFKLFIISYLLLILSCEVHEIDCSGIIYGNSQIDQCGVCNDPNSTSFNSSCKDCYGTINGSAILDQCGECTGGETSKTACEEDCYGEYGGSAYYDDCGICVGYTYYTNSGQIVRPPSVDSDYFGQGDGICDGESADNDIICDFDPGEQCNGYDPCPDYDGDELCDWEDDCIWGDTDLDNICNNIDDDDDGDGLLDIVDGCTSLTGDPCDCYDLPVNSLALLEGVDDGIVCYHTDISIKTFTFAVDGATFPTNTAAQGGDAANAGFTISTPLGGNVLTASTFSDPLPPGNGTLTILSLNGNVTGLSDIIFADENFNPFNMSLVNEDEYLIANSSSCNCNVLPTNTIALLDNGMVLYNVDTAIGGFEIEIEGTTISDATGGDAAANNFTVSTGASTVLGIAFGTYITGCENGDAINKECCETSYVDCVYYDVDSNGISANDTCEDANGGDCSAFIPGQDNSEDCDENDDDLVEECGGPYVYCGTNNDEICNWNGCGILTNLTFDSIINNVTTLLISDPSGNEIDSQYYTCE